MSLQFTLNHAAPASVAVDCVIVGAFSDKSLSPAAQALDAASGGRIAALVVAPEREEADILRELRAGMDPVFLPRPLRRVACLPRNETGKLPRDAVLALLRGEG